MRRPASLFGPSFIVIYRRSVKSELSRNGHVSRAFDFLGKKKHQQMRKRLFAFTEHNEISPSVGIPAGGRTKWIPKIFK